MERRRRQPSIKRRKKRRRYKTRFFLFVFTALLFVIFFSKGLISNLSNGQMETNQSTGAPKEEQEVIAKSNIDAKLEETKQNPTNITTDTKLGGNSDTANKDQTNGNSQTETLEEKSKKATDRPTLLKNLEEASVKNPNALVILGKADTISDELLYLAGNNPNAIDFVAGVISGARVDFTTSPSYNVHRSIPLYIQWDMRWGYDKFGSDIVGTSGCGPTATAMAISGLKKDVTITPRETAQFANENNFILNNAILWDFIPAIGQHYGLKVETLVLDEAIIKAELEKGNPIVISVGPGDFSRIGHIMVLVKVDDKGNFYINDPNSVQNSLAAWKFDQLSSQIKQLWVFSL